MSGVCSKLILVALATEDTRVRLSMLLLGKIDGGIWRPIYIMETHPSLFHHRRRCLGVTRNPKDRDHERDAQTVPNLVDITSSAVSGKESPHSYELGGSARESKP